MWITKEDLIEIAKDISKKQSEVNSMGQVCTSGWEIQKIIQFEAEYKVAVDDLKISQEKYDSALLKYSQQSRKDIWC